MPKRVGYLYDWMCERENIIAAIHFGAKGKKSRRDVMEVMDDVEGYAEKVRQILLDGEFLPQTPRRKNIYDQSSRKWRVVEYVRFFPDGIVHTLIVMAMEPVIMRGMYAWSCASVPGRGGKMAADRVKKIIRNDPKGTKYVAKLDIKKYYHSIDRRRLIWALARKIKDKKFLKLVWDILETCEKGLAIGYFICQWLANYYLEPLDHYTIALDGVNYMIRYMDDMVLFGQNKKKLHRALRAVEEFLAHNLGLAMKEDWQVFPLKARPLDFVGYRFYRTHTTLRRRNFLRLIRQCRRVIKLLRAGQRISYAVAASLLSRAGQLRHCDSYYVRVKYLEPIGIKMLKEVVSLETQRRQYALGGVYARGAA